MERRATRPRPTSCSASASSTTSSRSSTTSTGASRAPRCSTSCPAGGSRRGRVRRARRKAERWDPGGLRGRRPERPPPAGSRVPRHAPTLVWLILDVGAIPRLSATHLFAVAVEAPCPPGVRSREPERTDKPDQGQHDAEQGGPVVALVDARAESGACEEKPDDGGSEGHCKNDPNGLRPARPSAPGIRCNTS